jgi:alpha-glucuronidase
MIKILRNVGIRPAVWMSIGGLLSGVAQAEDGYDLWLRYRPIEDSLRIQAYRQVAAEVVVQGTTDTDAAIREELKTGLNGLLGAEVPQEKEVTREGALVVGTPEGSPVIAALNWTEDLKPLGPEGFVIQPATVGGRAVTVIASEGKMGALYGTFHFLRLLQTGQDLAGLKVAERPKMQRRLLNHWDNLDGSIERGYAGKSLWQWNELPGKIDPRYRDYARANASLGINGAVLNNVNAKPEQLSEEYLKKAAALAEVFRPYGIRVYLTSNFSSPKKLGGLEDSNPKKEKVREWWKKKVDEIYGLIPDFGGFLVKANSEGQPGPQDYGLTHADGANMLAEALAPHGGIVMWRAFVYNTQKVDPDRAKRSYLEFKPFDGKFASNVFVQPKNGPIDFQPREPFHPLFGAMPQTPLLPELEITQENMGHSTHLVYLAPMWKEFLDSDTHANGPGSTVASIASSYPMSGIAGVANTGTDRNWCGHDFAQANWYAFGRLAWNPQLTAAGIGEEWTRMTWGNDPEVVKTIGDMLKGSWEACTNYEMPMGLAHIMAAGSHYEPAPHTVNKGAPEYSAYDYHRADADGIGYDRSTKGSDAVSQYFPPVRDRFNNVETCPEELLLWFHHVSWEHKLKTGRTMWEELTFRYNDGVDYVKKMRDQWKSLKDKVDRERHAAVEKKLEKHEKDATVWRDTCVRYFQGQSKKPLPSYLKKKDASEGE